jgi:hypothetical protein
MRKSGDSREHAGTAQVLRGPIGQEWREDRERDLDARVRDPSTQPQYQPSDADAPDDFADDDRGEGSERLSEGEHADADGCDGEAIQNQGGRVVG